MRSIQKQTEPRELTEWRARYSNDVNFGYSLMRGNANAQVVEAVVKSLLQEQGWLCAYTGIRIDEARCHIEHIKAQAHCSSAETVAYANMLACFPAPNQKSGTPFGANQKGNWPYPEEQHLFVSPLDAHCEQRFIFNLRGVVSHYPGDEAAKATIKNLGLYHEKLTDLRKGATQGILGPKNNLPIAKARSRLTHLKSRTSGRLEEFCFALVQALEKHIVRLEAIAKSKRAV